MPNIQHSWYNAIMLKIRLKMTGKKHDPHYRIVVTEARSRRDGRPVKELGSWHPREKKLIFDKTEYEAWVTKGAQPTEVVRELASK